MSSIYEKCVALYGNSQYAVLQCMTDYHENEIQKVREDYIEWSLVLAASLVFFMQCGFAMLCAGSVRKKNVRNTMLKNLLDACMAAVAFFVTGYAFAYGGEGTDKSFVGNGNFFSSGNINNAFWFFQYACSATTVTIVAGTLAER